ncbi:PR domain zinc finger protein 2 [Antennarius striatus]|uniref:PR domain zinc finger protein 2 n=1 Tax=Antennarius striatus TaxID=241820 RepID=UPI0035B4B01E
MDNSPNLYIFELGDNEEKDEDICQEGTDTEIDWRPFPCQHCDRHFTSQQGLERHIHTHMKSEAHGYKSNKSNTSFGSNLDQLQLEKIMPQNSEDSVMQLHTSSMISCNTNTLPAADHSALPDKQQLPEENYACKYCEKIFTTHTNKRRHERRSHEHQLQQSDGVKTQLPQEESRQRIVSETSQCKTGLGVSVVPAAVLDKEEEQPEHYMLDVSSNISENLSFYIDGKIVSTSTVSSCDAAEVPSGSSTLVRLDSLILDPVHISKVLKTDLVIGKETPGQPLLKRRTATPPLLPQIKTQLESEVVVSSSSSSYVSSLIENLLPQNTESTVVQKERTVFLSPKLKQLLEKQDGLKPALALITDGQKPCSPVSLSVLPAGTGRFKRRTGSPSRSLLLNPNEETPAEECDGVTAGQNDTHHGPSTVHQTFSDKDDTASSVEDLAVKTVLTEVSPPIASGNSCNQQPLDLSNTVKRIEGVALTDAALDLSLQKKTLSETELLNDIPQTVLKEEKMNTNMFEMALMNIAEKNANLGNLETPLITDFTIVTNPDMMTPVDPVAEGLVYGLALPPSSLNPSAASLTPVSLQPPSPCTIAFASHASHTMLPTTPSLITVLAPPSISNPSSQAIQVLAPNISPEPLVICTENALNSSECDLTTAFSSANPADLVTLSHSLDPALNLPSHMFLTDQITLAPPILEPMPVSEVPFTPTVTLNDSLINSYNITSKALLIECTIALEAPQSVVPAAITLQENTPEPPVPPQLVVNHMEQQQIVSVPDPQTVDPTALALSIAESVTVSTATSVISDCPAVGELSSDLEPVLDVDPPTKTEQTEERPVDSAVPIPELPSETLPSSVKAEEDESLNNTTPDAQMQTFTKNFICNVCDKLFHSMKELGNHVGDHADEWPYKCEFCLLLFGKPSALLDHRSSLHGVGKSYVCSACTKEFVYLCNLKQHQEEVHPGQQCTFTEEEKGKLRPQNYNNSSKIGMDPLVSKDPEEAKIPVKKEESEDVATEELVTTIKVLGSDGGKFKGPDVRLGINQHYPSFKPPPFPYHNRSPSGSVASATNFTTHNIPQTFTTAIRCTKCGKSFDNMPELHKHILACANASDKRRYTPKKNPIPLRHFAKTQNGVLSTTNSDNGLNVSNRPSHSNRSKSTQDPSVKVKFKALNKRKKKLVQRVMPQRNKSVPSSNRILPTREQQEVFVCPHCSREFTMRRSRTKHMAVCPKKTKEVKKRKDGGISVTKENDGDLRRGVEEKQTPPPHKTRLQTSGHAKRPAVLPVQTVFSSKRSKIIIKETLQPAQEAATLNELPIVRTFNPSMRQYSRVQSSVKGIPIKITIVKPQPATPQKDELRPTQSQKESTRAVASSSEQSQTG